MAMLKGFEPQTSLFYNSKRAQNSIITIKSHSWTTFSLFVWTCRRTWLEATTMAVIMSNLGSPWRSRWQCCHGALSIFRQSWWVWIKWDTLWRPSNGELITSSNHIPNRMFSTDRYDFFRLLEIVAPPTKPLTRRLPSWTVTTRLEMECLIIIAGNAQRIWRRQGLHTSWMLSIPDQTSPEKLPPPWPPPALLSSLMILPTLIFY